MMTNQTYMSDLAVPPGEFLSEVLEDISMTQLELAKRMGRPPQAINEMIKGVKAITPETAIQLEKVVSVPAHIWTNLESEYRLIIAQEEENVSSKEEVSLVAVFPYLELRKMGFVNATRNGIEKVRELRAFFGVSSLKNLSVVEQYNPAFRLAGDNKVSKEAIVSWLRTGELLSKNIDTEKFSKSKLLAVIPKIRSLTLETNPHVFLSTLREYLADCGVALVVIPHYPKTYVTGATFWRSTDKAVVMMSLRGSWGDIFWFSLLHEIAHIVLHSKRATFIEGRTKNNAHAVQEREADEFASNYLIPVKEYSAFIKICDYSKKAIESFSQKIGIHAGIITGRLQHDNLFPYTKHPCRIRYKWK